MEASTGEQPTEAKADEKGTRNPVEQAERDLEPLRSGPSAIRLFGGEIPKRMLVACAIFTVVFLAVWLVAWAILGGIGLAVGAIVAVVLAGWAVRGYARG